MVGRLQTGRLNDDDRTVDECECRLSGPGHDDLVGAALDEFVHPGNERLGVVACGATLPAEFVVTDFEDVEPTLQCVSQWIA